MKLKRFNQFIAEAKVNESANAIVEENAFLVDGVVYQVGTVELEIETSYDSPEPEIGYYGGHSAESWSIYEINDVYKVTQEDIIQEIESIKSQSDELIDMGFSMDKQRQIEELVWDAETVEVTGPELAALEKRIIELHNSGQLEDLTGSFDKRCESAVDRAMEDYEDDGPDYDDYE